MNALFANISEYAELLMRVILALGTVVLLLCCVVYLFTKNRGKMVLAQFVNAMNGDKIEVNSWEVSLGRAKTCDIVLNYQSVSRFHAVVVRRNKGWIIYDTLSRSGVLINGNKIEKFAYIYDGDIITLGSAVLSFRSPLFKRPTQDDPKASRLKPEQIPQKPNLEEIPATLKVISAAKKQSKKKISALVNMSDHSVILLFADNYVIGRAGNCDVVLPVMTVSKWHAELETDGRAWYIKDLDSRSGVQINGVRIIDRELLCDEDVICIGGIYFKFIACYMNE